MTTYRLGDTVKYTNGSEERLAELHAMVFTDEGEFWHPIVKDQETGELVNVTLDDLIHDQQ